MVIEIKYQSSSDSEEEVARAKDAGVVLMDELYDPCCDPQNPIVVQREDVVRAAGAIVGGVVRTPTTRSRMSDEVGMELFFKKEYMQYTASFKDRGALLSLLNLSAETRQRGVVTTSAGNHSQALAYQAGKLGVPVTVFMPCTAPLVKVNSCRKLHANVILHGQHFDAARLEAMRYSRENELLYINGFDHRDIIAGQGTMMLEMLEDVGDDLDYVLVPIGGGGMVAGISAALKGSGSRCKIIGVESQRCPSWSSALEAGKPMVCEKSLAGASNSIADGLAVAQVGVNAFATCSAMQNVERVVAISEDHISLAILKLLEGEKAVVEGAGASGFAAILSGMLPELRGKRVGCILCGGNIDATTLKQVIDRGLVMDGRLVKFTCVVSDRCGGLSHVLDAITQLKVSIRDVMHERISLPATVYKVAVTVTAETTERAHSLKVKETLEARYGSDFKWFDLA